MQLLMSPTSPFVRKVRVLLREAEILDQVEEIAVSTTPFASDPKVVAANPVGKIPALIRTDGPTLYDSRVITSFLNDYANAPFYPEGQIWDILTLEATAEAIMEAAVSMTYEMRLRLEPQRSEEWVEAQWNKVSRAVSVVNSRWMSHLHGPLNMGQIAMGCALSYVDLRHDDRGWRTFNATLDAWHKNFAVRDSMLETNA